MLNYEYPPLGAGAGVITQHISEGLVKLGNHVTVLTTWLPDIEEKQVDDNLKIIRLRSKRKHVYKSDPFEMLSWILKSKAFLKEFCQSERFDVCFANFALPGGEVALYLKNHFDIPYVLISHGHDIPWFFPQQMFAYHLFTYFWIKRICMDSEANFIQTSEMKDNIDKFLGRKLADKNIIVPNGLDEPSNNPDFSQKSKIFKIVFVGRLVKQKDPFTFLKAIKLFSEGNKEFVVHILGDGPLRRKMENFVENNNLEKNVSFLGWISEQEVIKEYQSANLHVAPSLSEGMSIAILESLSLGQYIITTPVSCNRELIEEYVNGELMDIGDHRALFHKIRNYYEDKFLKGYCVPVSSITEIRLKYSWSNIVKEYDETLRQVVN